MHMRYILGQNRQILLIIHARVAKKNSIRNDSYVSGLGNSVDKSII